MNTIFYVKDTTVAPHKLARFQTYKGLVNYLEDMCKRAYRQDKKQRTQLLEEIGYGADDHNSTLFVRSMQEKFEIGTEREGRHQQCDVTTLVSFQKPEYGD